MVDPNERPRFQTFVGWYCGRLGKPHPIGAERAAAFALWLELGPMSAEEEAACRAWVPPGGERGKRWWPKVGAFLERWQPELERSRAVRVRPVVEAGPPADYVCRCGRVVLESHRKAHDRLCPASKGEPTASADVLAALHRTHGMGPSSASNGVGMVNGHHPHAKAHRSR